MEQLRIADQLSQDSDVAGAPEKSLPPPWHKISRDLQLNIIRRLPWEDWASTLSYVSREWLWMVLDAIFPPEIRTIDLRVVDSMDDPHWLRSFIVCLRFALDRRPTSAWEKLYFPSQKKLNEQFRTGLAERTSSLCYVHVLYYNQMITHLGMCMSGVGSCIRYWGNLRSVYLSTAHVSALRAHCHLIEELSLYGQMGYCEASLIAEGFPSLKKLVIPCRMSVEGLGVILDHHKDLELLDTRHCYFVDETEIRNRTIFPVPKVFWDEQAIKEKAAGVKVHLQCARANCPLCSKLYKSVLVFGCHWKV